jgi:hypothetical protein
MGAKTSFIDHNNLASINRFTRPKKYHLKNNYNYKVNVLIKLILDGYYLFADTSFPKREGQKSRIVSPVIPKTTTSHCLEFSYFMNGDSVGSISAFLKYEPSSPNREIFKRSGFQGSYWLHQAIDIFDNTSLDVSVNKRFSTVYSYFSF